MNIDEDIRAEDRDEAAPLPIVIRRLDKIETTDFPMSQGNSN